MKFLYIFVFVLCSNLSAAALDDIGVRFSPYTQYILSASVGTQSRTLLTNKINGDGYGFGLGARLGLTYEGFEGGLDLNHMQLGTKDSGNSSFIVDGETISTRSIGIYAGYNYNNIVASFSYFFSGDATISDEASYQSDEDSFRVTLGYLFQDKYLLSAEYMIMDNFTNSDPSESTFRLYLEEMFALSLTIPIKLF